MARTTTFSPHDQTSTLRNMKLLVVVLIVSNFALGAFSVYLLRSVDKRYSDLVGQAVPALNDLRELTSNTVSAMRSTNPRNFAGSESALSAAIQTARQRLAAVKNLRQDSLKDPYFAGRAETYAAIVQTGSEFDGVCAEYLEIYAGGRPAEAVRQRDEKMLPAFDRHIAAIGAAADIIESTSLATSKVYAGRTRSLSTMLLGVASWPVIVLLALLLLTAGFVIAMMIAFRGKDLADTP